MICFVALESCRDSICGKDTRKTLCSENPTLVQCLDCRAILGIYDSIEENEIKYDNER